MSHTASCLLACLRCFEKPFLHCKDDTSFVKALHFPLQDSFTATKRYSYSSEDWKGACFVCQSLSWRPTEVRIYDLQVFSDVGPYRAKLKSISVLATTMVSLRHSRQGILSHRLSWAFMPMSKFSPTSPTIVYISLTSRENPGLSAIECYLRCNAACTRCYPFRSHTQVSFLLSLKRSSKGGHSLAGGLVSHTETPFSLVEWCASI